MTSLSIGRLYLCYVRRSKQEPVTKTSKTKTKTKVKKEKVHYVFVNFCVKIH